jgi:hypothetical protein
MKVRPSHVFSLLLKLAILFFLSYAATDLPSKKEQSHQLDSTLSLIFTKGFK